MARLQSAGKQMDVVVGDEGGAVERRPV